MKFGLRLPSFALGPRTASLETMGVYLGGRRTWGSSARWRSTTS